MQHQEIQRTVTLADLIKIVHTWKGATLEAVNTDDDDNPTSVVLVDHNIRATFLVGQASDKSEPFISFDEQEERDRQAAIDQAHAIAEEIPDLFLGTAYESNGRISCWEVWMPSLNWRPTLPYRYCYTAYQLLMIVEEAASVYQHSAGREPSGESLSD